MNSANPFFYNIFSKTVTASVCIISVYRDPKMKIKKILFLLTILLCGLSYYIEKDVEGGMRCPLISC